MEVIIAIAAVLLVATGMAFKALTRLICIAGPNEVLVFSGPADRGDGRGYRTIRGGRRIRVPMLERVNRLDLTNMIIDVSIGGAYSLGGIPLNVQAVANVKVAGDGPVLHNALHRLLGKSRADIMKIAKETLEGNLRGVLATLTPEQVNEDKMAFAKSLLEEAEHDLSTLGITLDTLTIQNVTDDQGYLQAIGRKQSADLQRRARIAEASARAEAIITAANNLRETSLAQITAEEQIAVAEVERRIIDAESMRAALVAEQRSQVESMVARAQADCEVQEARIDQVRQQIHAEMIEPARARRDRMIYDAQGAAARTVEDGRARAEALRELAETWADHGDDAKQVLLMQQLERIVELMTSLIQEVRVDQLTFVDTRDGGEGTRGLGTGVVRALEELRATTGIDLPAIARRAAGDAPAWGDTSS